MQRLFFNRCLFIGGFLNFQDSALDHYYTFFLAWALPLPRYSAYVFTIPGLKGNIPCSA